MALNHFILGIEMRIMYLHIGEDVYVLEKELVAILNMASLKSLDFVEVSSLPVEELTPQPRSIVLTSNRIYLSPLTARTIVRRAEGNRISPEVGPALISLKATTRFCGRGHLGRRPPLGFGLQVPQPGVERVP